MDAVPALPFSAYQSAVLTTLPPSSPGLTVHLIRLSGDQLRLVAPDPLAPSLPVEIECGDWFAFGEVSACRPEYSHYAVVLTLDQYFHFNALARTSDWNPVTNQPWN